MAEQMKKRSDIEAKYTWRFEDIYPSVEAWEADCARVSDLAAKFAGRDGKVAEDPEGAIRDYFELYEAVMTVGEYAFLRREADNGDTQAQELADKATALEVRIGTAASFLEPELLALDDSRLQAMADDPAMADYDSYLRTLLRQKQHTLPKEQERLLAMMGEIERGPDTTYSLLTSVDMKYPDITMPDGSKAPLTEGVFNGYLHHADRDVRRQAFEGIMDGYGKLGNAISSIYATSVKTDVFEARARRYSSSRAARMEPLEIPEAVYDNLIGEIHAALPVLQDYLKVRREKLGLDELHMYDLYVPIVSDFEMKLPFEDAFKLVLEGLKPMGGDYLAKLQEAHDNRWMDVYPAENKSSGAFSAGSLAKVHPFVLLNHNDNLDSAFTIAHELGHSMHSYFSNTNQPFPKADYSLFVAEVASICNEAVMMRHLLTKLTEPKAQAYLLNHFLEQFRTTCFRQTMFAEFELISHRMAEKGEPLTRQTLSDAYYKLNQTYYGESCHVDELIANEWMRIPHFYRSFYVYVYATGLCAAITLSEKILAEGESAVKDYRRFLSAGSSVPPIEALKLAGIDMSGPEPIRRAMAVFRDTLEKFKKVI